MIKIATAFLCLCAWVGAQEQTPQQQQPPATQGQQQPAQQPPATQGQQQPAQQPPNQQPPDTNAPAQPSHTVIQEAPPELPKYPDVRLPGETGYWIGLMGWIPKETPFFDKGKGSTFTQSSGIKMQGTPKFAEGAEFGVAVGRHNALRVSYFETRAAGDTTASQDLTLWQQTYTAGTVISTNYRLQNVKLSFDYLTWPYPVESRRFRLKTLWQLQYTNISTSFDAPLLPLVNPDGSPIVDANGNPISYATTGSRWFIAPTFGLSATEYVTRHFRLEAEGSGFGFPHHYAIWDADVTANIRIGHVEVRLGGKAFHFKTSTQGPFYSKDTLYAPFVGLRWMSE